MMSPMQIDTAPKITVNRMLKRSASWPIKMPPIEEPNQASELASEGAERAPPRAAAIGLSPAAVIHSAPNDSDSSTTQMLATTQEDRVSMVVVTSLPGGAIGRGA